MSRFLSGHPAVCFSRPKEPHWFSQADLAAFSGEKLRRVVAVNYLARFFPEIPANAQVIAEASVSYLYAPEMLLPVLRLWPEAKFVIAVRDPFELIPSIHQRLLYQGDESVEDLERAWRLIGERRAGRKIPRSCVEPRQLLLDEVASLGKYVERFFEVIGRERCHVVVFDDLKADPARVYAGLLEFLGLPAAELPEEKQHRASQGFKIGWLQRLLKRPPVARTALAGENLRLRTSPKPHHDPSWMVRKLMGLRTALLRWNRTTAPQVAMSPWLQQDIRDRLQGDVALLSKLLGRDLSHWLGGARTERRAFEEAA